MFLYASGQDSINRPLVLARILVYSTDLSKGLSLLVACGGL